MTVTTEAPAKTVKSIKFETVTCYRCAGTGYYGPSSVFGGVCFKCSGSKFIYTSKGARARKAYDDTREAQMTKSLSEIKVGDRVLSRAYDDRGASYKKIWRTVESIVLPEAPSGRSGKGIGTDENGQTIWQWANNWHVTVNFSSPNGIRYTSELVTGDELDLSKVTFQAANDELQLRIAEDIAKRFSGATLIYSE